MTTAASTRCLYCGKSNPTFGTNEGLFCNTHCFSLWYSSKRPVSGNVATVEVRPQPYLCPLCQAALTPILREALPREKEEELLKIHAYDCHVFKAMLRGIFWKWGIAHHG